MYWWLCSIYSEAAVWTAYTTLPNLTLWDCTEYVIVVGGGGFVAFILVASMFTTPCAQKNEKVFIESVHLEIIPFLLL